MKESMLCLETVQTSLSLLNPGQKLTENKTTEYLKEIWRRKANITKEKESKF